MALGSTALQSPPLGITPGQRHPDAQEGRIPAASTCFITFALVSGEESNSLGQPDERATPPLSPRTTNDPHPIRSDPIAETLLISILPLSRLPTSFLTFFSFLSPPSLGTDREYAWYARFACPGDETKMLSERARDIHIYL